MENLECLDDIKQIYSVYLKYSTGRLVNEEAMRTKRSKSEIYQEALDEYFEKLKLNRSPGDTA